MQNLCHWIFDLDGTLTIAQHDFDAIRRELGVPEGTLILEYIAQCPADRARALERQLREIEHDLAEQSLAAEGAVELVEMLLEADADLGILTRNTRQNAMTSLASVGLGHCFVPENIVGRDESPPKPAPDGIHFLLERWQASRERSAMVGDFRFDLEAGRAAEVLTIHVSHPDAEQWPEITDHRFDSLMALAHALRDRL